MEGPDQTTRQRIADFLRDRPAEPATVAEEFGITTSSALAHVEHIARSLAGADEELLAAPPECRDCGFAGFDDLTNRPSRCPECRSENVGDPVYTID